MDSSLSQIHDMSGVPVTVFSTRKRYFVKPTHPRSDQGLVSTLFYYKSGKPVVFFSKRKTPGPAKSPNPVDDCSLFSTLFRDACAQYDKGSDSMRITSVARNGRAMLVAFIRDGVPLDALVEETNPRSVKCSIMDVCGVVERVDVMDSVGMFYQRIAASEIIPRSVGAASRV